MIVGRESGFSARPRDSDSDEEDDRPRRGEETLYVVCEYLKNLKIYY